MLVEMDGFGSDENVVVFAATNRKDILDDALTRPGRFDRNVDVTLPDIEARKAIYMVHLEKILCDDKESVAKRMSSLSPGFSGADIRNVCNEAAIHAARREADIVELYDFEMAIERTIGGLEKKIQSNEEERKIVAIHESGHAIVSWFLEHASPLLKLTIIPRSKGSLGFAQYLPKENSLETEEALKDRIAFTLGGRVAEEVFFGEVTNGAQDDFSKAYDMANSMVTKVGMSKKLYNLQLKTNQYGIKSYSDATNEIVDSEIEAITLEAYETALKLVKENKHLVQA
jgi:AFG3 family protein